MQKYKHLMFTVLFGCFFLSFPTFSQSETTPTGQVTPGTRLGEHQSEGFVDLLLPFAGHESNLFFLNPRFTLGDEGVNELNLGLGYRHAFTSAVIGGNIYVDTGETSYGNRRNQIGLGLELLTNWFDARLNWYEGDNDEELINEYDTTAVRTDISQSVSSTTSTRYDDPYAQHHSILQDYQITTSTQITTTTTKTSTTRFFEQFESGMEGFDAEIGFKLPVGIKSADIRLFAGRYDFDDPFSPDDIEGYKGRIEARFGPYLTFDAEVYDDDDLKASNYFVGARIQLPFKAGQPLFKQWKKAFRNTESKTLPERMRQEIVLRDPIQTTESEFKENAARRTVDIDRKTDVQSHSNKTNGTATVASDVTFVDGDNTTNRENGTAENPYDTIQEGVDNAVGHTVFVDDINNSGSYDEEVVLRQGQTLTSEVQAFGGHSYHSNTRPTITPGEGGTGITLADNTTVNRFHIEGGDIGIFGRPSANNVIHTITNNTIVGSGSNGIILDNGMYSSGVRIGDVFQSNATSFESGQENYSVIVAGNIFTGSGEGSLFITSAADGFSAHITENKISCTQFSNCGGVFVGSSGAGVRVYFARNNVRGNSGVGISLAELPVFFSGEENNAKNSLVVEDNIFNLEDSALDFNLRNGEMTIRGNQISVTDDFIALDVGIGGEDSKVVISDNQISSRTTSGDPNPDSSGIQLIVSGDNTIAAIHNNYIEVTGGRFAYGIDVINFSGSRIDIADNTILYGGLNFVSQGFESAIRIRNTSAENVMVADIRRNVIDVSHPGTPAIKIESGRGSSKIINTCINVAANQVRTSNAVDIELSTSSNSTIQIGNVDNIEELIAGNTGVSNISTQGNVSPIGSGVNCP